MSFVELGTGAVIRYPYLWSHRAGQGDTEGRKLRAVVVGVRLSCASPRLQRVSNPLTAVVSYDNVDRFSLTGADPATVASG